MRLEKKVTREERCERLSLGVLNCEFDVWRKPHAEPSKSGSASKAKTPKRAFHAFFSRVLS